MIICSQSHIFGISFSHLTALSLTLRKSSLVMPVITDGHSCIRWSSVCRERETMFAICRCSQAGSVHCLPKSSITETDPIQFDPQVPWQIFTSYRVSRSFNRFSQSCCTLLHVIIIHILLRCWSNSSFLFTFKRFLGTWFFTRGIFTFTKVRCI